MYKYKYKDDKWNDIYDTYWVVSWILKESTKSVIMRELYYNKLSIWLNYFWLEHLSFEEWWKLRDDKQQQLDITLDYILPLLKSWKLKLRIDIMSMAEDKKWNQKYTLIEKKEYAAEKSQKWIEDIKKIWLSFDNPRERTVFEEFWVKLTLPENDF